MSQDIHVLVEHRDGVVTELSFEMLGEARRLAAVAGGEAVALLAGRAVGPLAAQLGDVMVLGVEDPAVAEFSASACQAAFGPILRARDPLLVLAPGTAMGMDLGGGLAVATGRPLAGFTTGLEIAGGEPVLRCRLYGGRIDARVRFQGGRGICTVMAGSFPAAEGRVAGTPRVEIVPLPATDPRVRFRRVVLPDADDVEITREPILVSVGRGIGEREDLEAVEQLARALGGVVSSSRPVVDAGWLPRGRQVGRSGRQVTPRLYLALGISGAPEHLEGMRGSELVIAVNSDPGAPIFRVADYGAVADILDVVPALLRRLG